MAGYSGTPLATKLGIREGTTLTLLYRPPDVVIAMPSGVTVRHQLRGKADVAMAFFTERSRLVERITALGRSIHPNGGLWVAWPKRSSGVATDITDHVVREVALPLGLVDNKVCAVNETWTGLRLVWRVERRA